MRDAANEVDLVEGARALDAHLRRELPVTQSDGVQLRVDKIVGFELFNTRPYHNFETWSSGYRVTGTLDASGWVPLPAFLDKARDLGLTSDQAGELWQIATGARSNLLRVESEDLGEALEKWLQRREKVKAILAEDPPHPNQRTRLAVLGYHYPDDAEVDHGNADV